MTWKPVKMPSRANEVKYLIVGSKYDTSLDLVIAEISKKSKGYLRINFEDFAGYKIAFQPEKPELSLQIEDHHYCVNQRLKSVYFRAAVQLGIHSRKSVEEAVQVIEQTSFLKSLMVFTNAKWINHPAHTYQAEVKLYQLKVAHEVGFIVPKTVYGNDMAAIENQIRAENIVMKSSDTLFVPTRNSAFFLYSQLLSRKAVKKQNLKLPLTYQEAIFPKEDIRVTVIGRKAIAVKLVTPGKLIAGDWRLKSKEISYEEIDLPNGIARRCIALVKRLNLRYAGIDLILSNGKYYFIEINPTGEWAWLQGKIRSLSLAKAIAKEIYSK